MKPAALLIHVCDWEAGFAWYSKVFPDAIVEEILEFDFRALRIDDFVIEIVKSDEKVASGKAGTVLYWAVQDLVEGMSHFQHMGAELYRGPIEIENGLGMCQFIDPFGNLIGIRGPFNKALKRDV